MPDDHSEVVPLLPIPNRTVKRLCADDSAGSRVKVGHRQALTAANAQQKCWAFCFLRKRKAASKSRGLVGPNQEVVGAENTDSQLLRPALPTGRRAHVLP